MKVYGLPLEPSDVCQLAIGQGAMQATPLQIANIAATVVNGGTLYKPHFVEAIRDARGRVVRRFDHEVIRRVGVTQEALREVRAGMDQVTMPWGTAYGEDVPGVPFGGKTGDRRNRRRRRTEHNVVRRVRSVGSSEIRSRGVHGTIGRLRCEHRRTGRTSDDRGVLP